MRLYVCILGFKYLTKSVDCKLLDLVYDFASAIISGTRISFCVFVGADGAKGLQYLVGNVVFRCNEFNSRGLSVFLFLYQIKNLKILFHVSSFIEYKNSHFFVFYEIKKLSS